MSIANSIKVCITTDKCDNVSIMPKLSNSARKLLHDETFVNVLQQTNSPQAAMIAAEPGLANNKDYAKVKAQRMLKRTDVQEKIQKQLENMRAASLKNIKNTLTSDNEQLANSNAWKVIEHLRGTPVKRNINLTAKASLEDVLFD